MAISHRPRPWGILSAFKGRDAVVMNEGPLLVAGAFWLLVGAALLVTNRRKRSAHAPFA